MSSHEGKRERERDKQFSGNSISLHKTPEEKKRPMNGDKCIYIDA